MMTKKLACVIALSLSVTLPVGAQSRPENTPAARPQTEAARSADQRDLESDLKKMQVLLEQMQRNVAFVSSGDTPLKHQFQLEIEMWQLLIRDLEQKAGAQQTR